MFARECWTKEEFTSAVQAHLGISNKVEVTPLGLSDWAVRAGFVYEIKETRKMNMRFTDVDGKKYTLEVAGNRTVDDVQEMFRRQWNSAPWVKVTIKRKDDKPFFIEDEAKYSVATEYVAADDMRLERQPRADLTDRSFLIDSVRIEKDPKPVLKM
jgi:hypothetical protein